MCINLKIKSICFFSLLSLFKLSLFKTFLILLLFNSNSYGQDPATIQYRIYLIGDAGAPFSDTTDLVLSSLKKKIQTAGERSAVIFLGDNIYPDGLPPKGHRRRKKAEERIKSQLNVVKGYAGRAVFIPGNHDWKEGKKEGLLYIKEEEKFIEEYLGNNQVFFPKGGCPGPSEIMLTEDATLVVIDTQWWLHKWEKPGKDSDCLSADEESFIKELHAVLERNKTKKVIVAGHHPMYSHGPHGGYYPLRAHIFPLVDVNKFLYIPLPIIGSLYPLYRGVFGSRQDLPHPKYQKLKKKATDVLNQFPGITYVSGHDHSLQFIKKENVYYIVSGSGSKISYSRRKIKDGFSKAEKGFVEMSFLSNGTTTVRFFGISDSTDHIYGTTLTK